jgi:tetratricopeptide (TPR) repeat protein
MADTPIRDRIKAPQPPASPKPKQRLHRYAPALVTLVFACSMAVMVAVSGVLGAREGEQMLGVRRTATVQALIGQRFDIGLQLLADGNPVLAQANLEEVLRYQPGNTGARDLLATAVFLQTPSPTPLPSATPRPTASVSAAELFTAARTAATDENWDEVLQLTERLTALDPKYQYDSVADLRYEALLARGLAGVASRALDDLERGIFDLDQAEGIRALPASAAAARDAAVRYQTAIQYIGADWDTAIRLLRAMPADYRDVGAQLRSAYIMAGDAYAQAGNWCEARRRYDDAAKALGAQSVQAKLTDAATRCTESGGAAASGFTALPAYGVNGRISFRAVDASGAYQSLVYDAGRGAVATQTLGFSGAGIYSPDGSRYVQANAQQITVYGGGQATVVAAGSDPQWGPGGLIAFQGCSDGICGIHVVNPDLPGSIRRLTTSTGDIGFRWSPAGDRLVFSANRTGAWEIFTVSLLGDVAQLTSMSSSSGAPSWSPNGAQIAFLSNRDGAFGLFAMNSDGSGLQKLVDFGAAGAEWQGTTIWQ